MKKTFVRGCHAAITGSASQWLRDMILFLLPFQLGCEIHSQFLRYEVELGLMSVYPHPIRGSWVKPFVALVA